MKTAPKFYAGNNEKDTVVSTLFLFHFEKNTMIVLRGQNVN